MASFKPVLRTQLLQQAVSHNLARPAFTQAVAPGLTRRQEFSSTSPAASSSSNNELPQVPAPTPFCPDVPTFLKLIGRGLSTYASKIPSWEALFTLKSEDLRELGVEPARSRRYLNQWRNDFRAGRYGPGGDCRYVENGVAHLRVVELPPAEQEEQPATTTETTTQTDGPRKPFVWSTPNRYVVNVPAEQTEAELAAIRDTKPETLCRIEHYIVKGKNTIRGPFALPGKGLSEFTINVQESMWEHKRGRKIDGGERRRTEIRYKKRIQERREARERGEY